MPGSYRIDIENRIVYSRGWGVITDPQIEAHASSLRADPRFDPGFRQITDFRGVTQARVTGGGVRAIARINPFNRDARRAFVVATDEAFGLTRMFGFFTESAPDQFGIFRDLAAGFEWIGLDPATAKWPEGEPDWLSGEE